MRHELFVPLGDEQFIEDATPVSSGALGAEFLGWEFFSNFESRHEQVQFDHVRWPGGIPVEEGINTDNSPDGSREPVFDLTFENIVDWDREVSNGYSNDPVPREGIREMMEFAVEHNASFAMVAPTMRYIEMAFEDHDTGTEQARADIRVFATRLLKGELGALPKDFVLEIGSEYYSLPIWRDNFQNPDIDVARTAGDVFAAMVAELDDVLQDPELNPTGYDINIAVQLGRSMSRDDDPARGFDANGDINGGWGEHADNADFIEALQDAGALDAVDSLIWHRFAPNFWGIERGLWDPVNGGLTLSAVIDEWEEAAGRDLGLVGGHLAPAAQGDEDIEFNAPGLTNILQLTTGLLAEGMDHGTIFGLGFGTDGSLGFRSSLLMGGQLYGLMVESLPGMHVHDGFQSNISPVDTVWENGRIVSESLRVDDSVNSYVFENEDLVVMFLIAKDFEAETLDYTLQFEETFENVDITRLRDTGEQLLNPTTGELIGHFGEVSHEQGVSLAMTDAGSALDVTFRQDYEIIRVTLDRDVIDTFTGSDDDDLFRVNHQDDIILDAGDGHDTVQSSVNFSLRDAGSGRDLEDLQLISADDLVGLGNSLDNSIVGNAGNNHLSGVWGDDTLNGGAGNDTLVGEHGHDLLFGGDGSDHLSGGDGNDTLNGGDQNDHLTGGSGSDVLIGGDGHDTLRGGTGADRFAIDPASRSGDTIQDFTFGEDVIDLSRTPVRSYEDILILWADGRILIQDDYGSSLFLDGLTAESVDQFSASDFIFREGTDVGADQLSGFENVVDEAPPQQSSPSETGTILSGTDGDDIFFVDSSQDKIVAAGLGIDIVQSSVNFTLRRHSSTNDIENLELVGSQDLVGVGNASNNILIGNTGHNHLSGVWGDDTIYGNDGNDTLLGVAGADELHGGNGNDDLNGGEGNDTLIGDEGHDLLGGGDGADVLVGGAGNDTMFGGAGADRFVMSAAPDEADVIGDFAIGEDILDVSFWPAQTFEDLDVDVANDQIIIRADDGSHVVLQISLLNTNATLAAQDFVFTTSSATSPDEETVPRETSPEATEHIAEQLLPSVSSQVNPLIGTDGDDLFVIDDRDIGMIEAGDGTDTVQSSVDFTLRRHSADDDLENLVLVGQADLVGVGNAADNLILGNSGNNHLSGVWGHDTVYAGAGDDTLKGVNGDDWLFGMEGSNDISGGKGDDTLIGGIDDDLLMGDDGRDLLLGGEGNDTIFGGEGADRFVVLTQNSGYDVIQDFAIGEDILDLSFTRARSFDDLVVGIQEDQIVIQGSDGSSISLLHLGESDLDLLAERGTLFSHSDTEGREGELAVAMAYDGMIDGSMPDLTALDHILGYVEEDGNSLGW